jgi:hypothetical protein
MRETLASLTCARFASSRCDMPRRKSSNLQSNQSKPPLRLAARDWQGVFIVVIS